MPPKFSCHYRVFISIISINNNLFPHWHWLAQEVFPDMFKQMMLQLEKILNMMFPNAGLPLYIIHCIKFQKQGLPHIHIFLKYRTDCISPDDIDSIMSAEIPNNPRDAKFVQTHIIHKHLSGNRPPLTYCQHIENGVCICCFGYS